MRSRTGRPLRFLALTLASWAGLRIAMLWPTAGRPARLPLDALVAAVAHPAAAAERAEPPPIFQEAAPGPWRSAVAADRRRPTTKPAAPALAALPIARLPPFDSGARHLPAQAQPKIATPIPIVDVPPPIGRRPSRWSVDAWLLARGDARAGSAFGAPQLGGSQAGLRIAYALGSDGRAALAGRLTTPLRGQGREAALGIEWRPTELPVRLIAEMRIPLDGSARAGPAIGAVGGFGARPVAAGFTVETYGQAGVIDRGRLEGFVDGAARLARPLVAIGRSEIDAGGGLWGGAQPDAARLDFGPSLGLAIPFGSTAMRLTLDWRERIAGNARPGSGVTLTLGADF